MGALFSLLLYHAQNSPKRAVFDMMKEQHSDLFLDSYDEAPPLMKKDRKMLMFSSDSMVIEYPNFVALNIRDSVKRGVGFGLHKVDASIDVTPSSLQHKKVSYRIPN